MQLNISVKWEKPEKRYNVLSVVGQIEIGENFKELLYMPLDWWTVDDYKKQWQEGLERLSDHVDSCLIASIHNPHVRRYVDCWNLYKIDKKIYVRNYLFTGELYEEGIGDAGSRARSGREARDRGRPIFPGVRRVPGPP